MASLIVAGDTSGSVTIAAPAVASTPTLTLPTVSGTFITTASSGQSIPKAALPTGSVLQVVNVDYGTETSNATSTFADTGLTASITPLFSTSKILVLVNQAGCAKQNNDTAFQLRLLRSSTVILNMEDIAGSTGTSNPNFFGACSATYLDSPATTSATTYKTQFASRANTSQATVQAYGSNSGFARSTITLMEIAA